MLGVTCFKEVAVVENTSTLALVRSTSPYALQNSYRPRARNDVQQETVGKTQKVAMQSCRLKKLIELASFAPKDAIVSYKVFNFNASVDGKFVRSACANDDC